MSEEKFRKALCRRLIKELPSRYAVGENENLLYKLMIDGDGEFKPKDPKEPKRGQLAFQTDLLIKKGGLPLVVIETKIEGFTPHDVLTYSAKALKHKEVYPYLRYGLVVGDAEIIQNKFFVHNVGFDFALAIENTINLQTFISLAREQIRSSETLLKILRDKNTTKLFSTKVKAEYV